MTESEAIEAIQFDLKIGGEIHSQVLRDAVDVAIQVLEKVQARDKKVWHRTDEIPDTEDCYIVAWLPKEGQCKADSPHYYAIWSYEDGEWQIYVPNDFAGKEIILLAWAELPEPYHKECEENKEIDADKLLEHISKIPTAFNTDHLIDRLNDEADASCENFDKYAREVAICENENTFSAGLIMAVEIIRECESDGNG